MAYFLSCYGKLVFCFFDSKIIFQIFIFSFIVGAIVVAAVVTNLDNVMIAQSEEELKENEKQDFIAGVFDNDDGSSTTEVKREYSIELDYLTDFSIFATTRHKVGVNYRDERLTDSRC